MKKKPAKPKKPRPGYQATKHEFTFYGNNAIKITR